jgi:hypothetical protein
MVWLRKIASASEKIKNTAKLFLELRLVNSSSLFDKAWYLKIIRTLSKPGKIPQGIICCMVVLKDLTQVQNSPAVGIWRDTGM